VAFSRQLGELVILRGRAAEPDNPYPEIFKVTLDKSKNRGAEYLKGTFFWHIDGATDEIPTKASLLTAREIAVGGGDTEFASTYAAYEDLSEEDKKRFDRIRVVHSLEAAQLLVRSLARGARGLASSAIEATSPRLDAPQRAQVARPRRDRFARGGH